jgi:beta-lactamase class A
VKYIQTLLNFGRSKYFHHSHGVVYLNRRYRRTSIFLATVFIIGSGFFSLNNFILPGINHLKALQKKHPVKVSRTVLAESVTSGTPLPTTRENDALKELINEKIASYPSDQKWAVFMYDLKNGNKVEINKDQVMPAASLYKLFLLEALESKLPFSKWAYTWSGGNNIQTCVEEMLQSSDSACAEDLSNYIGAGVVNKLNQKNGFNHTSIAGADGRTTSADDVGELLLRLQKGQILSDYARRFVFDTLYQQINKDGFAAGCGDCRTADKIGQLSSVANDAGIVTYGNHSYVLVVLSQGGSLKQIADITKTIQNQ